MDWTKVPICFQSIPDPEFEIEVAGSSLPAICFPEENLSDGLRGQNIRIHLLLGFLVPPGNMKGVPASNMINQGLRTGVLKPGCTIVENTSGGMGAALAYYGRPYGIKVVTLVANNLPSGKLRTLTRLGAEVVKESEALEALDLEISPGSIKLADLYAKKIGAMHLNQYAHRWNPESYGAIAPELWDRIGGHAGMFVSSVGSRGTLLGFGREFRKWNSAIEIIGTMPYHMQSIDGTRTWFRQREVEHDLEPLKPYVLERIDQITARAVSDRLNKIGIPGGPSAGAGFGSAEHLLLIKVEEGTLDSIRSPDGAVHVILPFHDTRYPYDPE